MIKIQVFFFVIFFVFVESLNAFTIHVIGDSHCFAFQGIENTKVHHIGPITMHRIGRDGLEILDFRNFQIQENDVVILTFGEIDVRCHIGKQRDIYMRDIDSIITTLVDNYIQTLLENKTFYRNLELILYTVTPPIDRWNTTDFPIYGTLCDRVFISKLMNQKLLIAAEKFKLKLLDVYEQYSDEQGALNLTLADESVHILNNHAIREGLFSIIQ
jgi:hypothetical protein